MLSPFKLDIAKLRVNRTLHGRSVHRAKDVPGHNVVLGYLRPGSGDALDLFCPAGTPVFAMHGGRVSRIADPGGRLSCIYVAGAGQTTVYAHLHIKEGWHVGDRVKAGQLIGWVGRMLKDPHLHLEIWINGKSIAAPTPGKLRDKIVGLIND